MWRARLPFHASAGAVMLAANLTRAFAGNLSVFQLPVKLPGLSISLNDSRQGRQVPKLKHRFLALDHPFAGSEHHSEAAVSRLSCRLDRQPGCRLGGERGRPRQRGWFGRN